MRIKTVNPAAWYDIPGYDGKYQINYYGEIRRKTEKGCRKVSTYVKKRSGRRVAKINCKEKVVMKLMQITFMGDLPEGKVTYHKNGVLTDNTLNNIGIITRQELGRLTGKQNGKCKVIVKISEDGEIVEYYKSAREAGRKNHMSYQTILSRLKGTTKSLFAPDGYAYCLDDNREIGKTIRRIERSRKEECTVDFIEAPDVIFDF